MQSSIGEACDDGNQQDGDGCSDGVLEGSEKCDDASFEVRSALSSYPTPRTQLG